MAKLTISAKAKVHSCISELVRALPPLDMCKLWGQVMPPTWEGYPVSAVLAFLRLCSPW